MKWLFYLYYPLHLAILGTIQYLRYRRAGAREKIKKTPRRMASIRRGGGLWGFRHQSGR